MIGAGKDMVMGGAGNGCPLLSLEKFGKRALKYPTLSIFDDKYTCMFYPKYFSCDRGLCKCYDAIADQSSGFSSDDYLQKFILTRTRQLVDIFNFLIPLSN